MNDAARLVDELTTLLYEVTTGWQDSAGGHQIVRCGACRRKADRAESVAHESDCPVYRLIRAEAANTAVIRANAEEIADLEDARDELEARVNAVVVEIEHERKMFAALTDASVRRIDALTAERDELRSLLRDRSPLFQDYEDVRAERDAALARAEAAGMAMRKYVEGHDLYRTTSGDDVPLKMIDDARRQMRELLSVWDRAALAAAAPGEDKGGGEGLAILSIGDGA